MENGFSPVAELSERNQPTRSPEESDSLLFVDYLPNHVDEAEMRSDYYSPEATNELLRNVSEVIVFSNHEEQSQFQIPEEIIPHEELPVKRKLAYNTEFDSLYYGRLALLQEVNPELYEQEIEKLDSFIAIQMNTHLGEVHNAELSIIHQKIIDGRIYGKGMEEKPFVEVMRDGAEFVWKNIGTADKQREVNEIKQYAWLEELMTNKETPPGTMVWSISLPSDNQDGKYWHTFHDGHIKKIDEEGKPFMETRRYASVLTKKDYLKKMEEFGLVKPGEISDTITAAELFNQRFVFYPNETISDVNELNRLLQKEYEDDKSGISFEQFQDLQEAMKLHIKSYTKALRRNPYDRDAINTRYNAIRIAAQKAVRMMKSGRTDAVEVIYGEADEGTIVWYGEQSNLVEQVLTPCGEAGGYEINPSDQTNLSPFSVTEYAQQSDWMGSLKFKCPVCKHENMRPHGEMIKLCQNTGCPDRTAVWCGPKSEKAKFSDKEEKQIEVREVRHTQKTKKSLDEIFSGWLTIKPEKEKEPDKVEEKRQEEQEDKKKPTIETLFHESDWLTIRAGEPEKKKSTTHEADRFEKKAQDKEKLKAMALN